jgi:hypothetical protein
MIADTAKLAAHLRTLGEPGWWMLLIIRGGSSAGSSSTRTLAIVLEGAPAPGRARAALAEGITESRFEGATRRAPGTRSTKARDMGWSSKPVKLDRACSILS